MACCRIVEAVNAAARSEFGMKMLLLSLRDQDQRQAELKAASMKNMQQAANIISFRKNKPSDENRFKSDILDLKSETKSFWQSVELLHNREGCK